MFTFHTHRSYTLDHGVGRLSEDQERTLDAILNRHGNRLGTPLVVKALSTPMHHVFELRTDAGPILAFERRATPDDPCA